MDHFGIEQKYALWLDPDGSVPRLVKANAPEFRGRMAKDDGSGYTEEFIEWLEMMRRNSVDDFIIFRAQDKALFNTLTFYLHECKRLKCRTKHIDGVRALMQRVAQFQEEHPERVHKPD